MRLFALIAAVVACTPPAGGPSEPEAPTDQITLFSTVIDGNEPAIVLEAGGGADSASWDTLPRALAMATGNKVIAYDRAGFGNTPLPTRAFTIDEELDALRDKLDSMGTKQIVLVGESYGGLLATAYALRNPTQVVGLVLLDPMTADFATEVGVDKVMATVPSGATSKGAARMVDLFPGLVKQLAGKRWAPTLSATIITAGRGWWPDENLSAAWRASHEDLAADTRARLVVADQSQHDIKTTQPRLVVEQVRGVLTPR